jgi:hypothetical protein
MAPTVRVLLREKMAGPKRIEALIQTLPAAGDVRELSRARLGRLTSTKS